MGMSREERASARSKAEEARANRLAWKQRSVQEEAKRVADAARVLAKKREFVPRDRLEEVVFKKAPRLIEDATYRSGIGRMEKLPFVRDVRDWEPKGKGRETLFRSLADHLFARYRMPPFLWSVFFESDDQTRILIPLVLSIARGNSFLEEVRTGGFPVPLTRKMCHDVLQSPSQFGFLEAVRHVQVRTAGGDAALARAWVGSRPGRRILDERTEAFWATVIAFLAANPMWDRNQVSPLTDYLQFRRNENLDFSMKGRSATALFEGMEAWHAGLQRAKVSSATVYAPSGFSGAEYDNSHEGPKGHVRNIWRIREILTARDLAEEGRNNRHCVLSYAPSIERGSISIWSMTREDNTGHWHSVTIEVANSARAVVQVRGMLNRLATGPESNTLARWAEENRLTVSGRVFR